MQIAARIGGRPVSADEWIEVLSPYDGAPVARVPALGADHVAEAVAAAAAALERGDFPQHRRAEVLERAAELLAERTEEFAVTIAREAGKPIRDARGEAARCAATFRYSAVEARKAAPHRYVTKAMREVEFHEPVFLGDIVSFYTRTLRIGRTSITVKVSVEAERWGAGRGETVKVTEAEVILVAVDERGRPRPIREGIEA